MISQSLGPTLSPMAKKAALRTAQDIFALDKAFFLIEGHPSDFLVVCVVTVDREARACGAGFWCWRCLEVLVLLPLPSGGGFSDMALSISSRRLALASLGF